MSILNIKNKSTNEIKSFEKPIPLRIWAVGFIEKNKFTRDNFTSQKVFKELTRRQKDAIRYQLKKAYFANFNRHETAVKSAKKEQGRLTYYGKIFLSIWISLFLMVDIVDVYILKGASVLMAWQATVLVEVCILVAASSKNVQLTRVAKLLCAYNILIFAFMEINSIQVSRVEIEHSRKNIAAKRQEIKELNLHLPAIRSEINSSTSRMKEMYKKGYITSSTNSFEKIEAVLKERERLTKQNMQEAEKYVLNEQNTKSLLWLIVSSILYFLLRSVLQFFSLRLLICPFEEKASRNR